MLWIQTSEGALIRDALECEGRAMRGLDLYLMVDGVSLGKIKSYNKGEFYELEDLCETFPRWKLIHFLNHAADMNIEEVVENLDYVMDVSVTWEEAHSLLQYERMRNHRRSYPVHMNSFRMTNGERVYIVYSKVFKRNRTWEGWRVRPDRHVYL